MTSKIRVLQVIPTLGFGGAETGCYDLAHYLAEQDCKSYIVTSGGELLKYIKKEKVKVFRLPVNSKNPILIFLNTILLILIQLIFKIDIVHARSRAPAWSCYFSCFLTRRIFVTTFHGTYNFKNGIKKFYNSIMLRSRLIIAGSNFIFDHINENYQNYLDSKKKLLVIFRGINLDYFNYKNISEFKKNEIKNNWGLKDEKFTILLPGRLSSWKGQEKFIEALNILNEDYNISNFQAVVLGSDQGRNVYTKKLMNLVERYNLNQKIIFIEKCKNMPLAYSLADVIVSSSIRPEAFGRVAVEAQSMEKPIIASNIGGSNETIIDEKTGFLFESGDAKSLSQKLLKTLTLDETSLKTIGTEGRKNIIKKFNVEKMCFSTYSEYKRLLN